jgi:hypothetical protein
VRSRATNRYLGSERRRGDPRVVKLAYNTKVSDVMLAAVTGDMLWTAS